jgi:hypothetical protein
VATFARSPSTVDIHVEVPHQPDAAESPLADLLLDEILAEGDLARLLSMVARKPGTPVR